MTKRLTWFWWSSSFGDPGEVALLLVSHPDEHPDHLDDGWKIEQIVAGPFPDQGIADSQGQFMAAVMEVEYDCNIFNYSFDEQLRTLKRRKKRKEK